MRSGKDLAKVIRSNILWSAVIALVLFSAFTFTSITFTKQLVVQFAFELFAASLEQDLNDNPELGLPEAFGIKSYLGYETLPAELRAVYGASQLEPHGTELIDFDDEDQAAPTNGYRFYYIYVHEQIEGQWLILLRGFNLNEIKTETYFASNILTWMTAPLAICFLGLFAMVAWWLVRRMTRPTERLAEWARDVSVTDKGAAAPDFEFNELNYIAEALQSSLDRNRKLLERERAFLRHASHELRTPVTVLKGGLALLKRKTVSEDQHPVLTRLDRATKNMGGLIETLLWLGRDEVTEQAPEAEHVHMGPLLEQVCEELSYLKDGRPIRLTLTLPDAAIWVEAPPTPLQMVVSNLIRNALQHTPSGTVTVTLTKEALVVENQSDRPVSGTVEIVEGIGLALVRRVCRRCGWQCEITSQDTGGVRAELRLGSE